MIGQTKSSMLLSQMSNLKSNLATDHQQGLGQLLRIRLQTQRGLGQGRLLRHLDKDTQFFECIKLDKSLFNTSYYLFPEKLTNYSMQYISTSSQLRVDTACLYLASLILPTLLHPSSRSNWRITSERKRSESLLFGRAKLPPEREDKESFLDTIF